jgi:hypothetical protein
METGHNHMTTPKKQTKPESRKRNYNKPEIKKREQIKEVTQGPGPIVTLSLSVT